MLHSRYTTRVATAVWAAIAFTAPATGQVLFGDGCPGSWGAAPTIRTNSTPTAGIPFFVQVHTRAADIPVSLVFGASNTFWQGLPLPFDLTPFGFPGCAINVSFDLVIDRRTASNGMMAQLVRPGGLQPGTTVFVQALTLETSSSTVGMSRGLEIELREQDDPFKIAMLPDTQHYSDSAANIAQFHAQTGWIANNRANENIVFVTHVGDIVQSGASDPVQWTRAVGAMNRIHGLLPYSVVIGNHDFDRVSNKASATQFSRYFGPQRYAGQSWYVGASPDGLSSAQRFPAEGRDYLHLGFEWRPSDAAIEWGQSVLAANPRLPTIVSTHEHLGTGVPALYRTGGATPGSSGNNGGEDLFRKLVEPYPQVFLLLCGHVVGDGHRFSTPALGGVIPEVLADYQSDPNGGNGWMQLIEFLPSTRQIRFNPFSPTYVPGVTPGPDRSSGTDGSFTVTRDLDVLFADLAVHRCLHLRQGQDQGFGLYGGAVDTHVGSGANNVTLPGFAHGSADNVRIDGNGDFEQGLLQFHGIVGTGPGQVPAGTRVDSAILTLTTEGGNAQSVHGARLHRMLVPWNALSTWNSLGSGVQLGPEAELQSDADTAGEVDVPGTRSFDVTASVQAWVDGAPNHGWVLLANGTDRWEFRSSDWAAVVERPMLTIAFDE